MLKRVLPIRIVMLVVVASSLLFSCKQAQIAGTSENEAIKVVPDDAVWIMEARSIPELLKVAIQSDPLLPSIEKLGNIQPFLQTLRNIDSLITKDSRYRQQFERRPVVVSFHQTGKNLYQFLLIFKNQGSNSVEGARNLISSISGRTGEWSERAYNGQQIHRITFGVDTNIQGISLSENKGYLLVSPSPILLENAIRQMSQTDGLYNTQAFSKLAHTAGNDAAVHIYFNLKTLPGWLSGWMNPSLKKKMERFTRYGDWAKLDLTLRNDAIWMNGFAMEGDTLNSYLNLFKNQEPRKLEAERFLPANTAAYFTIGVQEPAVFLKGLSDYLGGGESGRKRKNLIDKANSIMGADVVKVWSELEFRELTIGYLCSVADQSIHSLAMIQIKSGKQAIEKLTIRAGTTTAVKPPRLPAENKKYSLYNMPFEGLPEILGGTFFSGVSGKYFTIIENQMLLADEIQTLEAILHKYSLNKTLATDAVYLSVASLLSPLSNASFFVIPYKARPLFESILNPAAISVFLANDQFIRKTGAVGLQFSSGSGMSKHNLFASYAEIDYTKPQVIWESKLDAKVYTRPVIVTNHLTKDKEIIVQDEKANLYLLSSAGRILWKKNIGQRINSEIFQVDIMKNGRLQYMFSTASAIHLLDRNGAYLPKYPVKLKLPSTNGMALIDFDGNRDYKIMIACSDNKVYGYDKGGNPIKGWNFGPASGPITQHVQSFKIQTKDYLVFTDPNKVYVVDRKGVAKVKPSMDIAVSKNTRILYQNMASGQGPGFILTDVAGNVNAMLMDGTVSSKKFGEYTPEHYLIVEDINKDGAIEYVFVDRNKLEMFNLAGEKIFTQKFDGNVTNPPEYYQMDGKVKKLGLTVATKNQILLFNGDGTVYSGFPLYGQTDFTIGKLGQSTKYLNLLVGSEEGYLYNYAIK